MKEMIRYGFDNLGQKSEPFSADHHRPRVGLELRRWQHLRFFEPSFGFGRKWRHRKKIRDFFFGSILPPIFSMNGFDAERILIIWSGQVFSGFPVEK